MKAVDDPRALAWAGRLLRNAKERHERELAETGVCTCPGVLEEEDEEAGDG